MSTLRLFPQKSVCLLSEMSLHKRKEIEFGPYMIKSTQMPQLSILGFLLYEHCFSLENCQA